MNTPSLSGVDPTRTALRTAMASLEREITQLATAPKALVDAFTSLDKQLALGPEPEVRACPACKQLGMHNATVCGNCWTRLTPP